MDGLHRAVGGLPRQDCLFLNRWGKSPGLSLLLSWNKQAAAVPLRRSVAPSVPGFSILQGMAKQAQQTGPSLAPLLGDPSLMIPAGLGLGGLLGLLNYARDDPDERDLSHSLLPALLLGGMGGLSGSMLYNLFTGQTPPVIGEDQPLAAARNWINAALTLPSLTNEPRQGGDMFHRQAPADPRSERWALPANVDSITGELKQVFPQTAAGFGVGMIPWAYRRIGYPLGRYDAAALAASPHRIPDPSAATMHEAFRKALQQGKFAPYGRAPFQLLQQLARSHNLEVVPSGNLPPILRNPIQRLQVDDPSLWHSIDAAIRGGSVGFYPIVNRQRLQELSNVVAEAQKIIEPMVSHLGLPNAQEIEALERALRNLSMQANSQAIPRSSPSNLRRFISGINHQIANLRTNLADLRAYQPFWSQLGELRNELADIQRQLATAKPPYYDVTRPTMPEQPFMEALRTAVQAEQTPFTLTFQNATTGTSSGNWLRRILLPFSKKYFVRTFDVTPHAAVGTLPTRSRLFRAPAPIQPYSVRVLEEMNDVMRRSLAEARRDYRLKRSKWPMLGPLLGMTLGTIWGMGRQQ